MEEDEADCIEGVGVFKYIGRQPDWSDDDCPAVRRNIRKTGQVWGCLGKILRREGSYQLVSEIFYRAVVQAVLLFGVETWVLLAAMDKTLEGFHLGFLWQVMGQDGKTTVGRDLEEGISGECPQRIGDSETGDIH